MPVKPITDTDMVGLSGSKYPNPFFDLANNYLPKNIKTLFKFCRSFFYTNGFLRNVVTKLTEYPITDILYDSTVDKATKELYDKALHEKLNIKSFLIEVGLDYYTYGNAFVSTMLKSKRFVKFPGGDMLPIEDVDIKVKNFQFFAKEPKGMSEVQVKIHDEPIKTVDNLKFLRWAPENIDIDYNPITGTSIYYYTIPAKIKSGIVSGNKAILKDMPLVFLESLKKKKKIVLDEKNLFHFKRPTLAEDDMGWGKPLILPALKEIYYLQTLKRGNEAISNEHIVPKKAIYPANTTTLDPYTQMNLGKWKSNMESQIKKWRRDPNHIGVFPIPIGYQELGGNARAMLLTPEMRFVEESIINSMGVPLEFIKGGASWTGSSISLRIVENHFLTYRQFLTDFLNHFVVGKLQSLLSYPKVTLKFSKFKMSDDAQAKQLAVNLNSMGKISDARLLDEFGYSYEEESEAITRTKTNMMDEAIIQAEKDAEAQGRASVILGKYNIRAQKAAEDESFKLKAEIFQQELIRENQGIPEDPVKLIEKYAYEIFAMDPVSQEKSLRSLMKKAPVTYGLVLERIQLLQMEQQQADAAQAQISAEMPVLEKAPNQKEMGKREGDKIKLKGEKTKGQTRGEV
tara:strand:+ start:5337 stop:7217 length:1881 start_codon:yes stop_codon:yes gene_type:complete